jgi:hypothetical protein
VIEAPLNDDECLGPTTDQITAEILAGNPAITDLAKQFTTTDDLAAWFRTLPQRDDDGIPTDGPKVDACRPAQRLQFDNPSPNCFERSARFIGAAELIEPHRVYRLATVATPNGLHTFPTRDGEPVILDPKTERNHAPRRAMCSGVDDDTRRLRLQRLIGLDETKGVRGDLARARRSKELGHTTWVNGEPIDVAIARYEKALAHFQGELDKLAPSRNNGDAVFLTPAQAIDWIAELAMVRADCISDGPRRIENGRRAMRSVLVMRPICVADIRDVALVLALAEREARRYGIGALKIVHSTARAIDSIDTLAADRATGPTRNNPYAALALSFANNKQLQQLVGGLARVAGRVAGGIGLEAAKLKLASVGVSPPVIAAFERELNREGLSLGPLAKPTPMVGSLDAMTPQALAARWLAQKI